MNAGGQGTDVEGSGRVAYRACIGVVLVVAVFFRFYNLTSMPIWFDESFSIQLSNSSLASIWELTRRDVHPPLYYLSLHGWRSVFGSSLFAIRSLSAIAGVFSVVLVIWLARLMASRQVAVRSGVFLALLPVAVVYSQEVRMYSLLWLWLLGATIALFYWVNEPRRHDLLLAYVLLMTGGFYTHYFSALVVAVHWFYLAMLFVVTRAKFDHLTRPAWWLANAAIVLLYVPWIPSLFGQMARSDKTDIMYLPEMTVSSLPSLIWSFLTGDDGQELPRFIFLLLPVVVLLAGIWLAFGEKRPLRPYWLLVSYAFLPVAILFMLSWQAPLFESRYMSFAALGLPIILAVAIDRMPSLYRQAVSCAVVAILLGGLVLNRDDDSREPVDQLAAYVAQHAMTGDEIVVDGLYWYYTFSYYNKTAIRPLLYPSPWGDGENGCAINHGGWSPLYPYADGVEVNNFTLLSAASGRVWLVGPAREANEEGFIPSSWQVIDQFKVEDMQARLYAAHAPSTLHYRGICRAIR